MLSLALTSVLVVSPPPPPSDEDWLELDRELSTMALQPSSTAEGGPALQVWTRAFWQHSDDEAFGAVPPMGADPGSDLSGFGFGNVRVIGLGSVGDDFTYLIGWDADKDSKLIDAFVDWSAAPGVGITVGYFRPVVLWSGLSVGWARLSPWRTPNGNRTVGRDLGWMLHTTAGDTQIAVAVHNGFDGTGDEHLLTARVVWNPIGEGAMGLRGGAYGYGNETNLSFGFSVADDGAVSNGRKLGFEAAATHRNAAVHFDLLSYEDGFGAETGAPANELGAAGNTPWSVTASYMFGGDAENGRGEFEVFARLDDENDDTGTRVTTVGGNWYGDHGHSTKWQLAVRKIDSDDAALEGTQVAIGLILRGA